MEIKNLKIYYKSGDGESWIDKVFKKKEDSTGYKELEVTEEETDELEKEFNHLIFAHNHDDDSGNGNFTVDANGKVISSFYQSE